MSQTNQEKPSLILMLAPVAFVLIGYQFLFHSDLNSDLSARHKQATQLQARMQDIQRKLSLTHGQLHAAKKELTEAKQQTELAQADVVASEAEKAQLRSFVLGQTDSEMGQAALPIGSAVKGDQAGSAAGTIVSNLNMLGNMLVKAVSTPSGNHMLQGEISGGGTCSHMNSLCSILDAHGLRRVGTSDPSSAGSGSLIESERTELEKLLDTTLPPISRYEIQLVGSFPNLIAALHDLAKRLPAVSILSVSLDPVDVQTQRHVWRLEVGIRG